MQSYSACQRTAQGCVRIVTRCKLTINEGMHDWTNTHLGSVLLIGAGFFLYFFFYREHYSSRKWRLLFWQKLTDIPKLRTRFAQIPTRPHDVTSTASSTLTVIIFWNLETSHLEPSSYTVPEEKQVALGQVCLRAFLIFRCQHRSSSTYTVINR